MASVDLEYNQGFKIYNANGTRFNNLVLHKATYETVVMSLGDKISGIVYYKNNKLVVNMTEYIMYKDVKYVLVNPPTIIKEGLVSDNGELKGMTKYSFTFYHPMYMLSNFPFSDVAVDNSQKQYLSQNKTFSWIGNLVDYKDKLNKNLEGTQWKVSIGTNVTDAEKNKLSEVLSFDNNTIADALKTAYETWEIPYVIDQTYEGNKRFLVRFGLPNNEIYEKDKNGNFILDDNNQKIPFVFKYGQGVGLKNNSRTPKNNKIVTRIAGYGSEDNIPYGYPQIVWTGESSWNYTINNASGMQTITVGGRTIQAMSYPIYDGIVGGQKVRLIKHPFTRTHLMPPIYKETVNKKVNPNATGYDPDTEIVDYYDANDNTYPNQIKAGEQSYEIHEFEDIKPEFGSFSINSATPYDGHSDESITQNKFLSIVEDLYTETDIKAEKTQLNALRTSFVKQQQNSVKGTSGNYEYDWSFKTDGQYKKVKYTSSGANFEYVVNVGLAPATIDWDDTMDEQGNYVQSYFKVTIPALGFDLYASAAITQEMTINIRSGACIGCSFPVMVDWDDYKRNFYDKDGNFAPNGTQRNLTKYPNSTNGSITLILQKETNTFGTLMPNIYQKPASGDKFVILGISLPTSYITTAEGKLETEMKKYMRDNNVYYYEYPLKFDEHFLISNEHILSQMKPNVIVNFEYADVKQSLYIKQMSIKYNESPLPKYDITLTDDVDVVLNKIGEAIAEYRGQRQYENGGGNSETLDGNKFLRKDINDTASGTIRMLKGLQVGERFVTGLLGEGGIFRKDDDGTTYLECDRMYVRMKAYFDTVEVRRFLHSGGNRIASAAGIKCSRVEYIAKYGNTDVVVDANGQYWVNNRVVATLPIERYRCYFRAQDNGVSITNDFVAGDQAYCKETNANLGQHGYWRLVVGKTNNPINGELWIDLSATDCLSGSDIPIAQDDIIQLGHRTDKTRQGAIIEYVSGEDAPSYQIYQGINSYSLEDKNYIGLGYSSETKRAYMNVYGDMFIGVKPDAITGKSPTYIEYVQDDGTEQHKPKLTIKGIVEMLSPDDPEKTTTLDDFAKAITDDIEHLQQQVDGEIDTWFYDGEPNLENYPASEWTTDTEKKEHIGDLYYDKLTGNAYRFIYDKDSETYSWLLLSDSAILEALRIANEAKDTADHKRRVFLTDAQHPHPTPPYDEGDLWVNAVWPYEGQSIGSTYNDEFLKCTVAKAAGQGFAISDWSRTSTHAENVLQDFIEGDFETTIQNIKNQIDHKVQTWYQSTNPADLWEEPHDVRSEHVGDLWYCTTDIEDTNFKKDTTWQYVDNGEGAQPRYQWKQQNVPEEIFDKIDGKRAIYSEWGGWMTGKDHQFNQLQEEDLFIPQQDTTPYDVTFKANKVYRCTNAFGELIEWPKDSGTWVRVPRFQEIAYTDDSAFNKYITQILNGTTETTSSAIVANALNAITTAITKAPATAINGGLVLTSLIGMRDANSNVWAGISGLYKATESVIGQYKGHGIAAWYGGGMADWEVYKESNPTATINDTYAKSLFRFDGSGYLAGGNITWTKNGQVTISDLYTMISGESNFQTDVLNKATLFSNLFHTSTTGTEVGTNTRILPMAAFKYIDIDHDSNYTFTNSSVLNYGEMKARFVPLDFFNALFAAFSTANPTSSTTPIDPKTWTVSTVINNLKIKVGTWTEQYLSALGNNPNASGGGGISDLSAVLNELNSKDDLGTGVLVRNGLNNWSWMPYNAGTSGIDENAMWDALGGTISNQKIDNSHLSINSLTFKAGASDTTGVVYSPTGDAKTITFDAAANSGISVTKDSNGTFIIGYTMPDVTFVQITDTDTTYTRFVVDAKGRVVKADKPTTLAGYGINDAVGSATKWWGQSIQTVNNEKIVKGNMADVGNISMGGNIFSYGTNGGFAIYRGSNAEAARFDTLDSSGSWHANGFTLLQNGNIGIHTHTPAFTLDVNGIVNAAEFHVGDNYITTQDSTNRYLKIVTDKNELIIGKTIDSQETGDSKTLHINYRAITENTKVGVTDYQWHAGLASSWASFRMGDTQVTKLFLYKDSTKSVYLVYDERQGGVHLVGAGFYADEFVSALGSKSSGGQDYFNADMMWQELAKSGSNKIDNSHLDLSDYALLTNLDGVVRSIKIGNQTKIPINGLVDLGSIASGGYITPIDVEHTNEAKGDGNVWFKRASKSDNTPTGGNGVVIEYGLSTDWVGRLFLADDGSNGMYWSGVSGGDVQTWKKFAFTSDLDGYAKKNDFKTLKINVSSTPVITYKPSAESTISFKAGTNISLDTTTANQIEFKNTYTLPQATSTALGGVKVNGYGLKMDSGVLKVDDLSGTYVTLSTAQTITGVKTFNSAIGVLGGLTPIAAGQVNTVSGAGMLWIKRALRSEGSSQNDGTPNNGIVFELGGTQWCGRLYMGDNGKEGLYWGGVYDGNIQTWQKFAFQSELSNYLPLAGGVMTGAIQFNSRGNCSIYNGSNDVANDAGGALGNLVISSSNGVSFTTSYGGQTYTGSNAVSINCRNGNMYVGGILRTHGIYLSTGKYGGFALYAGLRETINNVSKDSAVRIERLNVNGSWAGDGITLLMDGNIGLGTNRPSYKLEVNGYTKTNRLYLADGVFFEKTDYGVRLVGAGFYSESFVSALGSNPDTPGGGGGVIELTGILGSLHNSTTALSTGALYYNGSTWSFQTLNQGDNLSEPLKSINNNNVGSPGTGKKMLYSNGGNWSYMDVPDGYATNITNGTDTAGRTIRLVLNNNSYSGNFTVPYASKAGEASSASTAEKLETTGNFTAWGRTFFTGGKPQSVSGNLENVGNISMGGNIFSYGSNGGFAVYRGSNAEAARFDTLDSSGSWHANGFTLLQNGNIGIHTHSPNTTLDISGTFNVTGNSSIGGALEVTGATTLSSTLKTSGKVAINNDITDYWLYVNGNIRATQSSWLPSVHLFADSSNSTPYIDFHFGHTETDFTTRIIENESGVLSVTAKTGATGLVVGTNTYGDYIKIGGAKLRWTGTALECDKDFYSTGAVSALGSNASGGGGGISDISVSASLSGTILTINVSGQSDTVDLSPISGTSGEYIPLSGGSVVTGNLNPADGYNNLDLGNSTNKWRQIWGKNFIGETIELLEDKIQLNFRATQHDNFGCKVGYRTSGNEALVFANKNSYTSFMFYTGRDLQEDTSWYWSVSEQEWWNYELPAMQIRRNSVYINSLVTDGTEPQHTLHVNGTGYFQNAVVIQDGGIAIQNGTIGAIAPENSAHQLVGKTEIYGNVGVGGSANDSYKLDVNGVARATELRLRHGFYIDWDSSNSNAYTIGHDQEDVYADGDWYGRWVSSSDVRLKDIDQYLDSKLEDIALAPIFSFRWKNKPNKPLEIGTSAQYWKEHLPYGVTQAHSGYLALDYGATALAAAVFTARKVVDHELRIKQLEQENAILRKEIEELKAA